MIVSLSKEEYDKLVAKSSHLSDKGKLKLSFMGFLKVRLDHAKTDTPEEVRKVIHKAIKDF